MNDIHYLFKITTDDGNRIEHTLHIVTGDKESSTLLNETKNLVDASRLLDMSDDDVARMFKLFEAHINRMRHDVNNIHGVYRIYPGLDAFEVNGNFIPYLDVIAENKVSAATKALSFIRDLEGRGSENTISSVVFMHKF